MNAATLRIDERFCGPHESGNGGYVAGRLAREFGAPCRVRLQAPPPLEHPLRLQGKPGAELSLWDDGTCIASAVPAELDLSLPDCPSWEDACAVSEAFASDYHPFPRCFVCGPDRAQGDGLRIAPGRRPGERLAMAPWRPDASLADDGLQVASEFVWAALDCVGAYALDFGPDRVLVLGEFAVQVLRPPRVGEACVVVGWPLEVDGRKHFAGTALFGADGAPCGFARATWIELRSPPAAGVIRHDR